MTDILAKILATKAEEIAAQKAEISLENMKVQARTAEPPRDFYRRAACQTRRQSARHHRRNQKSQPIQRAYPPRFHPDEHAKDYEPQA